MKKTFKQRSRRNPPRCPNWRSRLQQQHEHALLALYAQGFDWDIVGYSHAQIQKERSSRKTYANIDVKNDQGIFKGLSMEEEKTIDAANAVCIIIDALVSGLVSLPKTQLLAAPPQPAMPSSKDVLRPQGRGGSAAEADLSPPGARTGGLSCAGSTIRRVGPAGDGGPQGRVGMWYVEGAGAGATTAQRWPPAACPGGTGRVWTRFYGAAPCGVGGGADWARCPDPPLLAAQPYAFMIVAARLGRPLMLRRGHGDLDSGRGRCLERSKNTA